MSKLDSITAKAEKAAAGLAATKKAKEAHRLGFDDIADYDLWKTLESLRSTTLKAREVGSNEIPTRTVISNHFSLAG